MLFGISFFIKKRRCKFHVFKKFSMINCILIQQIAIQTVSPDIGAKEIM